MKVEGAGTREMRSWFLSKVTTDVSFSDPGFHFSELTLLGS